MPRARAGSLIGLATAMAGGELSLSAGSDRVEVRHQLLALPGIGGWTADYLLMRAVGDPDVYLGSDLGIKRAVQALPDIDPAPPHPGAAT